MVLPDLCMHANLTAGFSSRPGRSFSAWVILSAMSPTAAVMKLPSLSRGSPPFHGFIITVELAQMDRIRRLRLFSNSSEWRVSSSMTRTTPQRWNELSSTAQVMANCNCSNKTLSQPAAIPSGWS